MCKSSYSDEYLVSEAKRLIDQFAQTDDPAEVARLDSCFVAVQEVMLAGRREGKQLKRGD